ncbi:MAG: C2 domain-containing protein [Planctomycetota bacterium]|nr:C2 domain-containing protein [Planctomycetota bacterium]
MLYAKRFVPVLVAVLLGLASAVEANQYKILVTGASFAAKKRVGNAAQPWDLDGKPDPYVVVAIDGRPVYVSGVNGNVWHARWFTGTEYWRLPTSAAVTITVRDADVGKTVAGIGMVGVAVRPDLPRIGKRVMTQALSKVDTDDTAAVWTGTLGQLVELSRGNEADLAKSAAAGFQANVGVVSLKVRVIERPNAFGVAAPPKTNRQYVALSGATLERVKRGSKLPWDAALGAAQQPDPRYIVYVNGSPVVAGGINRDSFVATWGGHASALDLRTGDTIAVALFDADAGSKLTKAGKAAVLFSPGLSADAKTQVFETLSKTSTDDLVFLWVGDWDTLRRAGSLPRPTRDPNVWWNGGLTRAVVATRPPTQAAPSRTVRLTVVGATIAATKSNGKPWDSGRGKPDPMVRCFVAAGGSGWAAIGRSAPVVDSVQPAWRLVVSDKRLVTGARIKIEIYDKDKLSDDLIDTIVITVPNSRGTFSVRGKAVARFVYQID